MNAIALCPFPLRYFSPSSERITGQKLASTRPEHSVLVAKASIASVQLAAPQRLSSASDTAYGLPYEAFDHV